MKRTRRTLLGAERDTWGAGPEEDLCPGCQQSVVGLRCDGCGAAVRVGRYRILRPLGGTGRTFLAQGPEGRVVLREWRFPAAPTPALLQGLVQDTQRLQALVHPRIPRSLEVLTTGSGAGTRAYRVQEYIEGTPLETELARERFSEPEAHELATQVLGLLRSLHERPSPVFHGAVKPSRLIRRPDGALFLVGFGMPSEGGSEATPDLPALGLLLKQALSTVPSGQGAPRPPLSPGFARFLERLSAQDRRTRFASAFEAMRALDPSVAPQHRPPRSLGLVVLGAGLGFIALGGALFLRQPPPSSLPQPTLSPKRFVPPENGTNPTLAETLVPRGVWPPPLP
ncbi:hypothetical protein POL68_24935 [Stigmatella sp. ncwal1]|uniref:Protein kinase domain-containing protein n=1 Tax=Stigmatella ashevillensis TaxID=2995309 RepID=A0ABT5DG32_9BACT|nr:hypothetical protein [Stigmatella ashevillena]MDC0711738.1 hypothetical protein [Stigmatella ashevillena]